MTNTITLAPFEKAHLTGALTLSQAVSWPHREDDWAMLLDLGHGTVALDENQVIGTALGCRFGPEVSVANMIIVDDARQGQGLGRKLMEAVLPASGTCRLVATAEGLPLYTKLGFEKTGAILQFQGVLKAPALPDASLRPYTAADLPALKTLESTAYRADRSALVDWLAQHSDIVVSTTADGEITGYAAKRAFGRGHVIGPVAAPDLSTAKHLIATAAQDLDGRFTRIDTHEDSGLGPWLTELGLAHVGGGTVMQKGDAPFPAPRFALFSQALG